MAMSSACMDLAYLDAPGFDRLDWGGRMRGLEQEFHAVYGPAEEAFLAVGARLQEAHDKARNLASMANALAWRLNSPEVQDTLKGLDISVAMVASLRRHKEERDQALADVAASAADIRSLLSPLAQIISRIAILGINAKIEVEHIAADTGTDFGVFTREIVRLASYGRTTLKQAGETLGRLSAAADAAIVLQQDFADRNIGRLSQVEGRLEASVAAMRAKERQAAAAMGELPKLLEAAYEHIGTLVTSLQIGDIARQRLEHVEQATASLARTLSGEEELPADGHSIELFAALVCDLETRQLDHLQRDVLAETDRIGRRLDALAGTIADINSGTLAVYGAGFDGGESFLLAVDHDLEAVEGVVECYAEALQGAEDTVTQVSEAATALGSLMASIADIDAEINVIGLNASIKCGNLGTKGRALNVIASELRAAARQTQSLSAAVAERLQAVGEAADHLARDAESGKGDLAQLKAALSESVSCLRQAGGETAWVLSQIQEQSAQVIQSVRDAVARFDVAERYTAVTERGRDMLDGLSQAVTPGLSAEELERGRGTLLRTLEERYTMASERDIHHRAETTEAAQPQEVDLSDILF